MDDPFPVGSREAQRHLYRVIDRLAERQSTPGHPFGQCLSLEQLRHEVRSAIMGADIVDGEDVGVIEHPGGARLLLEVSQAVLVRREGGGEHLDRHVPAEPRVPGAIDFAHPAGAQKCADLVRAQASARRQRHW